MGSKNDLTGMKFGRLTALRDADRSGDGQVVWLCRCECGKEVTVRAGLLRQGRTLSCGCLRGVKRRIDISGERFGRLVAVRDAGGCQRGPRRWLCQCDCGNTAVVSINHLKSGDTSSCGCLASELASKRLRKIKLTHGKTGTPEFNCWQEMLARCRNDKHHAYHLYGGRGVAVCDRWNKFETFLEDMGERPSSEHSLDRVCNDGDYEPSNCRWATVYEQAGNRSTSRIYTIDGVSRCIAAWARECGVNPSTAWSRLERGKTIEQALGIEACDTPQMSGGIS